MCDRSRGAGQHRLLIGRFKALKVPPQSRTVEQRLRAKCCPAVALKGDCPGPERRPSPRKRLVRRASLKVGFSDRARLSTVGHLSVVVNVLESSRCRSRFSTQSGSRAPRGQRRCTHWSDGTESHAFARALTRSSLFRLHPDHRPHLNETLHNHLPLFKRGRSRDHLLRTPTEHRSVGPHPMQDDGELARYRDHPRR